MNYTNISTNEALVLSLLERNDLPTFGIDSIAHLSGWGREKIHNTIASLLRKGRLTRVSRGRYTLTDAISENIFQISSDLLKPSYISFWTALSHYGFTEQQVKTIQLVSTKQIGGRSIGNFKVEVITLKPQRFYGYLRQNGFVIAEPEKALVDSLFRTDLCGGLDEFAKCLSSAWMEIDEGKLIRYAIQFGNRSLISRLGYLIEKLGLETPGVGALLKEGSRAYVTLDLERERVGEYDKRWRVIVNHSIDLERII